MMENVDNKIDKLLNVNDEPAPRIPSKTYSRPQSISSRRPSIKQPVIQQPVRRKLAAQDCSYFEAYDYRYCT